MLWLPAILILPYVVLLYKIYGNLLRVKTFNTSNDPKTFVSVVIACRNEQNNLPVLLKHIAIQHYSKHLYEVIIVDDNSVDNTVQIVSDYSYSGNISIISNNGTGKKQALRTGIEVARGNLIITTDADCRMRENWIRSIAAFYEKNYPDLIICPVQLESDSSFLGRFQELEFISLQGITAGSAIYGDATMCNGANLAFKREAYLNRSATLHDEINSGDDIFLLHSLKKGGQSKILWMESPDALITTGAASTVRAFLKQRCRWISKSKTYRDSFTIFLGIVTFTAILMQLLSLIASFFSPPFIQAFLIVLVLKSVPDFLIILNTTRRYGKQHLMKWFLPSQLLYPFYVLSVVLCALLSPGYRDINFPFQKET
jgi:biofilm PGA synthesis N-glycosyltransferase PgaC